MSKIADASINSFGPMPGADESPEESIFVLTSSQLRQIIQDALQPLRDEVEALREERDRDREDIASLRLKLASLESLQEQDTTRILLDVATDRRRLAALEHPIEEPTDTEKERTERIEKLCTDAPKHEISLSELRGRLGIDKSVLSRLLKRIDRDKFYLRKSPLDKRVRYLCLRPEVR